LDLIIPVVTDVLAVVGASAAAAAFVPARLLGPVNAILQFLAMNFGQARNRQH
jgi:hypothetical protein